MRDGTLGSKMVAAAIATGAALALYLLYVRPRHIRWGATDEEVERPMPGESDCGSREGHGVDQCRSP